MKFPKVFFIHTVACVLVCCCISMLVCTDDVTADTNQTPNLTFGTTVDAALQISIRDGMNLYGRRTIFSGSGVEFGRVSFTNPMLIANGDAYVNDNRLFLEAVLDINIAFSGLLAVNVELSKLVGAANPFAVSSYSLSKNRSELTVEILPEPRGNRLVSMTAPGSFPLRLVFEVSPQQSGVIADRLRIVASSQ